MLKPNYSHSGRNAMESQNSDCWSSAVLDSRLHGSNKIPGYLGLRSTILLLSVIDEIISHLINCSMSSIIHFV